MGLCKRIAVAVCLSALVVGCSTAQRRVALGIASTALLTADWVQTQSITQQCAELNPVLGRCGERVSPNIYFPTLIAGHLALAVAFPEWSDTILGATAGAELATVWSNWANGVSLWNAR